MLKGLIKTTIIIYCVVISGMICELSSPGKALGANAAQYQSSPPFVTAGVPPLLMLVMGRNHKLYYEAYNDASDLNEDGELDVGYNPDIDYYGYFDSYKYYEYSSNRFEPVGETSDKKAPAGDYWSGDFINYLTMTRMDCLRKVLYGGYRSTDTSSETILERVFVPQDAHSWGKEYYGIGYDGYDIRDYTPLDLPAATSRHLFASTTLDQNGNNDGADDPPLLRVLENSVFRIWEWVAIERPVAGSQGNDGSGRRNITDNDVSGTYVDVTDSGSAGDASDSYSGSSSVLFEDDFNDGDINDSWWNFVDNEAHSGTYHEEIGGELIIKSNGADVYGIDDEFAALYQENVSGDFDYRVRVTEQEDTHEWAKCGIMVRNDMTQPGSSTGYAVIEVTPENGFSFQGDTDKNGFLEAGVKTGGSTFPPDTWVRMTREGDTFTGYYSTDGVSWIELKSETIDTADTEQDVGLFVSSHSTSDLSEVHFDEMSLRSGVEPIPDNAFDDDANTQWHYPNEPGTGDDPWIEFDFDTATEIKAYTINGGDDAPDDWTLQGSNDQTNWTILDSVTYAGLIPGNTTTFECDSSAIYEYYRLVVSDTSDPGTDGFSIKEIEMMETTEPIPASATLTDYEVRVKVCDTSVGVEPNTKQYPSGVHKPIGILQRHGEADQMYFGLITGSYTKNLSGGVLRDNINSITNEIDSNTGEFLYKDDVTVGGIINTIDKLRIIGFDYGSHVYNQNCGLITTRSLNQGECRMWGNPTGEMMYEALRYFAGKQNPTAEFDYDGSDSGLDDNKLGLPKSSWDDPYANYDYCAKPFMLVLSDIYPTYDSDQLPGSKWAASISDTLTGLDVESSANTISDEEGGISTNDFYIGQSADTYNGACTPKTVSGFGNIRGLCPEEPTKQGSYYSASVAYHGNKTDLNAASGNQKTGTYCVGLSSPLPEIDIKVGSDTITLIPFAKSVGGNSINASEGNFQPTNTIVDFFVEVISPTYGKFRINFEDVEQGNDHDMDAIVEYEYQVTDVSGNPVADSADGEKVKIDLNSTYAAGSVRHHLGYIMSGTSKDGTYLVVRDEDTSEGDDPDYFLDTPPGEDPGGNWDDDTHLPLTSSREFEPGSSSAASDLTNPLWYAAKWGGFEDYNSDGTPDQNNEWDKDGDGSPDTYFYVQNPLRLEEQLNRSFTDILRRTSSGTAASVVSQTRSGEGAVYQAVFYPEYKDANDRTVNWVGAVQALFVDSHGNMREDTDGDGILDLTNDRIIVFKDTVVEKYVDSNGDGVLDDEDSNQDPVFSGTIDDVNFLWNSSEQLNEDPDIYEAPTDWESYYSSPALPMRYIFTFVDEDQDMVVDSGEQMQFSSEECNPDVTNDCQTITMPSSSDLTDTSKLFPYLNLFPTFEDESTISIFYDGSFTPLDTFRTTAADNFEHFLQRQSQRVINYIRGKDYLNPEISHTTPSYILPPFRSRQTDYDDDGVVETWRLGDIVYSTPTVVGTPAELYHRIYNDQTYDIFRYKNRNRRQVVYAGANDGMFHAFNAGFYDSSEKKFNLTDGGGDAAEFELGAELWAYIPYNLLPHLYWLTEIDYPHVYYADLKPKVFDAKVFPDGVYDDGDFPGEPDWGTLLVGGMRLGGGEIVADMNKKSGKTVDADNDRTMTSAYFILDITDPESKPKVIAELSFEHQGYSTCYPAVLPITDRDADGNITGKKWFLVFGSGPADNAGKAGTLDSLGSAQSNQPAKLYVVDLKSLVEDGVVKSVDSNGVLTSTPTYYKSFDTNAYVSDPISVDFNMDYSADVVYFGTVSGDSGSGWGGKLRRVVIDNEPDPADWPATDYWSSNSVLIDAEQPITAAPSVAMDDMFKKWIYFGTGRFFVGSDKTDSDQQSYYGIIEPFTDTDENGYMMGSTENFSWAEVTKMNLLEVTDFEVYDDESLSGTGGAYGIWGDLMTEVNDTTTTYNSGWYLDFSNAYERNLGQAALLGELLIFNTFIPSDDICSYSGESNLYALYYKTGTAFHKDIMGTEDAGIKERIKKKISLGTGLAITPNIHSGAGEGSTGTAFVQTSTGDIKAIKLNKNLPKSGIESWEELR